MELRSLTSQDGHSQTGAAALSGETAFDLLRASIGRPDLDDASLLACLSETLDVLGLELSPEDLVRSEGNAQLLSTVLRCTAFPQPRFPMAMPDHSLNISLALPFVGKRSSSLGRIAGVPVRAFRRKG